MVTRPIVLKLGGRALDHEGAAQALAREIASLDAPVVVVHGGGRDVSELCARLGLEPRFVNGLRVTDPATLEIAVAMLAGLANKRLVAVLRAHGVDAVGLAALDGGVIDVDPHPDTPSLGAVGRVRSVRPERLEMLLAHGVTPVIASIGASEGALLNVNADEIAGALAAALSARALLLLSDVDGVSVEGRRLDRVAPEAIDGLLALADVHGGMIPKLEAARTALANRGSTVVTIGAWQGEGSLRRLIEGGAAATRLMAVANPTSHTEVLHG